MTDVRVTRGRLVVATLCQLLLWCQFAAAKTPATASDAASLAAMRTAFDDAYPDDAPGAVVLVAKRDRVVLRTSRGLSDVGRHALLEAGDVFRIGSISKQFTAAGLMTLVQAGKLSLNTSLSTFIANYPNGDRITMRDLLGHTSGIKSYTELPEVVSKRIGRDATTDQVIDSFKNEAAVFAPGTAFAYSNSNSVLAARVIEAVTGKPWAAYLDAALFSPAGMGHTDCAFPSASDAVPVTGYSMEEGNVVPASSMNMSWAHAAAGCMSTVDDLLAWNRALHEDRLLDDATYRQMIAPSRQSGDAAYGLGVMVRQAGGTLAYGHDGFVNGYAASMLYVPASRVTVIVLENNDGGPPGEGPGELAETLAGFAAGLSSDR